MMKSSFTIEPMQAKYNRQVSQLLVHAFSGKFSPLTRMGEGDLALLFEELLDAFPGEQSSQRVVAIHEETVIGTLCLKWKPGAGVDTAAAPPSARLSEMRELARFGRWKVFKLLTALHVLSHEPQDGECYIADLSVHPLHRGKGTGKLLLQWAHAYAVCQPQWTFLSLHVSGSNAGAKRLYEQFSFHTQEEQHRLLLYVLVREWKWEYMILPLEPTEHRAGEESL
ncbi:acetyltransferase [Paenibacillus sp. P3E]|nr:acetyltransferase [Paenibacillus sp. P3E]